MTILQFFITNSIQLATIKILVHWLILLLNNYIHYLKCSIQMSMYMCNTGVLEYADVDLYVQYRCPSLCAIQMSDYFAEWSICTKNRCQSLCSFSGSILLLPLHLTFGPYYLPYTMKKSSKFWVC